MKERFVNDMGFATNAHGLGVGHYYVFWSVALIYIIWNNSYLVYSQIYSRYSISHIYFSFIYLHPMD